MGWNKEFRPVADFFPTAEENPIPGGVIDTGKLTCVDLCIADGNDEITLGAGDTRPFPRRLWYDASSQVSIRLVANEVTASGAGHLAAVFRTSVGGSDTDAGDGGIEVPLSLSATGPAETDWFTINAGAQADVLFEVVARDADGTEKVRGVHIQFLNGAVDPCAMDGGCPMPADIYNGEDFSSYADEAAFIAFVEGESNNFYDSWYGDDYEETCEFDPDLTFCGNPVVVGRWQGISDGSPSWARTGYGGTTRFSNPVGDDGTPFFQVQFKSVWATMRFKIEDGWNTGTGTPGFLISEIVNTNGFVGSMGVYIRDDRLIMRGRATTGDPTVDIDIGPASMIIGTSDFVEVTLHGVLSPVVSGLCTMTVEVFINPACSGGSAGEINTATPLATYTKTSATAGDPKFNNWDKFDVTSTDTQWPEKRIWVAQAFYSGSLT